MITYEVIDYRLEIATAGMLAAHVKAAIAEGWQPFGSPVVMDPKTNCHCTDVQMTQPMVKEE